MTAVLNKYFMNRTILVLALVVFGIASCSDKKKAPLTGDELVEITDFIEFFPQTQLPYVISDTLLGKNKPTRLLLLTRYLPNLFPTLY